MGPLRRTEASWSCLSLLWSLLGFSNPGWCIFFKKIEFVPQQSVSDMGPWFWTRASTLDRGMFYQTGYSKLYCASPLQQICLEMIFYFGLLQKKNKLARGCKEWANVEDFYITHSALLRFWSWAISQKLQEPGFRIRGWVDFGLEAFLVILIEKEPMASLCGWCHCSTQ